MTRNSSSSDWSRFSVNPRAYTGDLLNDDATIAALLGHKSISSVAYYRQMSPKVLAESTKPVIDARNEKIKKFKKGWME